jgi:hypothetical protein
MQNEAATFLATLIGAVAADWLICGRLAALAPSVRYRYRPTVVRYVLLFLTSGWIVYGSRLRLGNDTTTIVGAGLLIPYFGKVMADVFAQKESAEEPPADDRYDF